MNQFMMRLMQLLQLTFPAFAVSSSSIQTQQQQQQQQIRQQIQHPQLEYSRLQQRMSDYFQTTWSLNHGIETYEVRS